MYTTGIVTTLNLMAVHYKNKLHHLSSLDGFYCNIVAYDDVAT